MVDEWFATIINYCLLFVGQLRVARECEREAEDEGRMWFLLQMNTIKSVNNWALNNTTNEQVMTRKQELRAGRAGLVGVDATHGNWLTWYSVFFCFWEWTIDNSDKWHFKALLYSLSQSHPMGL